MADFLMLFRGGREAMQQMSPDGMQAHMKQWGDWIGGLAKQGVFKGGDPLDGGGKVLAGANKNVTDGPYAEAKDLVGGYLIVSAKDEPAACEIAKGCPIFETGGSVEVRKITPMDS